MGSDGLSFEEFLGRWLTLFFSFLLGTVLLQEKLFSTFASCSLTILIDSDGRLRRRLADSSREASWWRRLVGSV